MTKINKVLVANRGEIACRVIKTCRQLGIATVAVCSDVDRDALHVELADEAVNVGPAPARESYLVAEKIIAAALATGADAIHPGYGFLSENAGFAEAIAAAGLIFIGPPPNAIRAMGGKSESKALMEKAGVPLVPGYHGDAQDADLLLSEAKKIGFPVLVKASAGGGGKGMRVVENVADFPEAVAAAKREAQSSFGSDKVLIEKYLAAPRHVEIQVFADMHGHAVYLFERDCSVQRRHQKVIEEAPAPGLSEATRKKMGEAAVAAAKAINYVGAGTVEFLLDGDDFYFMEMNTRLQVEHPVTELITGLDLVEWQIRVAEGEALPLEQDELAINGHAVEVRLYTEDPNKDFLPGAGQISFLRFPMESDCVRVDTGVREAPYGDGDVISIHYDPMVAKIIAWGKDREAALDHLAAALDETHIAGPKSNIAFLRRLARHPAFRAGAVTTGFINDHRKSLLPEEVTPAPEALALAALGIIKDREAASSDPWDDVASWRIGGREIDRFTFRDETGEFTVSVSGDAVTFADGRVMRYALMPSGYDLGFFAKLDNDQYDAIVLIDGTALTVMYNGYMREMIYADPLHAGDMAEENSGRLTAPMPGKVVAVKINVGDQVKKGQTLVVVEAMKMEHAVTAPADGVVDAVNANVGDQVSEKLELVRFK